LQAELKAIEVKLKALHRADAMSRRLAEVPGIGPVTAAALVMKAPDPHAFRSGRLFAAWLGLTPKDHSTGGKLRLGKAASGSRTMIAGSLSSCIAGFRQS
jgi:transposase